MVFIDNPRCACVYCICACCNCI